MTFLKRHVQVIVPLCLFFAFVGLHIGMPDLVGGLKLKVFDVFQRMQPRVYHESPVAIVDVDDASLSKIGQWPWSRNRIAELVNILREAKVSAMAFDVVFAEKDRTSPQHLITALPPTPEFSDLRLPDTRPLDYDLALAGAMKPGKVVTAFSLTQKENKIRPAHKGGFAFSGESPEKFLPLFRGAVIDLPELESAAAGNGSFNVIGERDGVLRRIPLLFNLDGDVYPALVLEALRVAQGASNHVVKTSSGSGEESFGAHTGVVRIKTGNFVIPTDSMGRMWLYDTGSVKKRYIPAWRILERKFAAEEIAGKIVFIGTSAEGLKDLRTTPLMPLVAGVEVHAQLAEQILNGEFLNRPDWAPGAELLYLLGLGLILVLLMYWIGALWCALIGVLAIAGAFVFSWLMFVKWHLLFDAVIPSMAVLMIYLSSSLAHFLRSESERRQIRSAFSHYMSPAMVAELAKNPDKLKLGGEVKDLTLLFADVRDFTAISERFGAEELTWFLNRFLTPMTDVILKYGGTIDKYMGDCIVAFWNAPLDDPRHVRHACEAALQMRARLVLWNEQMAEEAKAKGKDWPRVRIGMGLNSGDCCVGNMGSEQRFDYSALGDTVNLASRIEALCKTYGTDILIGENTNRELKDFAALELDWIRVKGKTQPVRIFALLGDPKVKESTAFQAFEAKQQEMLAAYRLQKWDDAECGIGACEKLSAGFPSLGNYYDFYRDRIRANRNSQLPPDWDGVFIATTK
ncbi:MAG: adenylate/guanylate cyclase domain-containing protein [Candidatus Omnitrophica bacterium]|nr:adenylate/guanylate cyclase domain-containing protein [Candidatus Omnitrophota bacterium]MDD5671700.1 adenylate/guanylate cyclase domain-containing protein [Candidatus Omnitrophota bacterium]